VFVLTPIRSILRGLGYTLALMGAAVGGFPPPKMFAREELPEEVIERVMEESELDALDGWESSWGLLVDSHSHAPKRE
jgi:hypothetical protein